MRELEDRSRGMWTSRTRCKTEMTTTQKTDASVGGKISVGDGVASCTEGEGCDSTGKIT